MAARSLERREYWTILAVAVLVFLVIDGPIWSRPFRIDGPILISYAVIPVLVLGVLGLRRRLRLKGFLLDTGELVLVKYAVTTTIAALIWAFAEPPALPDARASYAATAGERRVPLELREVDARDGRIEGRVTDAGGEPIAGAFVYVAAGLESMHFRAAPATVVLENDGGGFAPELAVVEVGQTLDLRSLDRRLHTAAAYALDGTYAANLPMLAHGAHGVPVERALGLVEVRCTVHAGEAKVGHLAVLGHPFHTYTGGDGRFVIPGVPRAEVRVAAWHPQHGATTGVRAEVEPGRAVALTISYR